MIDESKRETGFFCMKLVGFISDNNADYWAEFEKAKAGNCSYKECCPIYKRTIAKHKKSKEPIQLLLI